ncbi:MAG: enoyl-CoA hydratase, partial [Actinobacteria bacterium]|nr:enoyl-CoA hydratase [Actinomycetota bacterium]
MPVDLNNLQATRYEVVNPGENGIAVVTLNRPESRNAQNKRMTYELEAC